MTQYLGRNLTDPEARAFKHLAMWEELVDKRRLFGVMTMSDQSVQACVLHGIAQPLRVDRDRQTNLCSVRFNLVELFRYIKFTCDRVGFSVSVDGEVTTRDGMRLSVPCIAPPPIATPPPNPPRRRK